MKKIVACALLASTTLNFAMNRDITAERSLTIITAAILKQQLTNRHLSDVETQVLNNQTAARGFTVLHLAASTGYKDGMNLLVSHGADASIKDDEGKTAQDLFEEQQKKSLRSFASPLRENYDQEPKPSDDDQTGPEYVTQRPEISIVYNPLRISDLSPLHNDDTTNFPSYASLLR